MLEEEEEEEDREAEWYADDEEEEKADVAETAVAQRGAIGRFRVLESGHREFLPSDVYARMTRCVTPSRAFSDSLTKVFATNDRTIKFIVRRVLTYEANRDTTQFAPSRDSEEIVYFDYHVTRRRKMSKAERARYVHEYGVDDYPGTIKGKAPKIGEEFVVNSINHMARTRMRDRSNTPRDIRFVILRKFENDDHRGYGWFGMVEVEMQERYPNFQFARAAEYYD